MDRWAIVREITQLQTEIKDIERVIESHQQEIATRRLKIKRLKESACPILLFVNNTTIAMWEDEADMCYTAMYYIPELDEVQEIWYTRRFLYKVEFMPNMIDWTGRMNLVEDRESEDYVPFDRRAAESGVPAICLSHVRTDKLHALAEIGGSIAFSAVDRIFREHPDIDSWEKVGELLRKL